MFPKYSAPYTATGTVLDRDMRAVRVDIDAGWDGERRWYITMINAAGAVETFSVAAPAIGDAIAIVRARLTGRGYTV